MADRRSFLKAAAGLAAAATSMAPRTLFGDMPGDRRVEMPSNVPELFRRRSQFGKLFKLPGRHEFRSFNNVGAIHWRNDDGDRWRDIDCTWRESAGHMWVEDVGYRVQFDTKRMMMTYRSRKGGELRLRLADINGKEPHPSSVEVFGRGDRFRLRGVADGVDLVVVCRGDAPEIYRKITGPTAPAITWEIEDDSAGRLGTNLGKLVGWDNHDLLSRRDGMRQKLPVEIEYETTPTVAGLYRVTERLTGRTKVRDPETRIARWNDEIRWPVFLDVSVNENTSANADDGNGYNAGASEVWQDGANFIYFTTNYDPAWRFQTVDIPNAATINSATLTIYVHGADTTMLANLHGQLVDSAEAWTNNSSNGPERMTRTTANTAFGTFSTTGSTSRSVVTQLQEIVNQGGWAANNNARLGCRDASVGSGVTFRALNYYGSGDAGKLASDYTSGGAPTTRKLMLTGVGD